ncbi:hypothetical protein M0R45_036784 [Rubus argutus]|uniref:Uncharacterized protein n=1 Tax=Rubus argutus TaxID=59490 RepID=A0AAW1W1P0_RUBAR
MGKWRHRAPRRFFRQKASKPISSTLSPLNLLPLQDGIPHWEKEYCTLIGSIPWWKVVDSKKLCMAITMYSTLGRLSWERQVGAEKKEDRTFGYYSFDGHNWLPDTSTNPWECDNVKNETQGWNQGNNRTSLINGDDNPWERSITQSNERMENTAWEDSRDKSWRWSQMGKDSLSKDWDDGGNAWERDCQGVTHVKGNNRWGDPLCKSWGSNQPETKKMDCGENPWECSSSQNKKALMTDKGWKDCRGDDRHWKKCDSHNNQTNNLDFRIVSTGWGARNGGGQKREHSHQYISGHQSSRFRGSDCQTGRYWRRENNKRVN